jgi:DNA polymerase I-like protein with 3'-5' exonuclease and polymerase domains
MAHMPQSTANDICLRSAVLLDRAGVPLVNLVHDELIAEVDKNDVEETKRIMERIMIDTAEEITEHYVPWKVGLSVGASYGDFS